MKYNSHTATLFNHTLDTVYVNAWKILSDKPKYTDEKTRHTIIKSNEEARQSSSSFIMNVISGLKWQIDEN